MHHLLQALLIRLVPPWQLTNTEVAEQKEEGLDVILLQIFLIGQMGGQGSVHGRADDPKVVLLLDHELLQGLHRRLLLARFWVDDVLRIIIGTTGISTLGFRGVNGWVRAALFFGEAEVDQVYEMGFV